jgi:hypothetical protein
MGGGSYTIFCFTQTRVLGLIFTYSTKRLKIRFEKKCGYLLQKNSCTPYIRLPHFSHRRLVMDLAFTNTLNTLTQQVTRLTQNAELQTKVLKRQAIAMERLVDIIGIANQRFASVVTMASLFTGGEDLPE